MYQYLNDIQKRRLFNSVVVAVILLSVFLAIQSLNGIKENKYIGRGAYSTNVINVSGTGEVLAVPDIGQLSFSVVQEAKTVGEAQDTAAKKINSIINALKGMGIAEKDIKTSGYNSYPKYEYSAYPTICANGYCPPSKQVLTGYEVSQTITLKIRNTANAGAVLTKVGDLGATNISGLDFVIDNIDAIQDIARDKAIQDAKAKAQVLEKSLGIKLNKIVNFQEGGNFPVYYGMEAKAMSADSGASTPTIPQVPTGENKITSNVTITYEVN